MQKIIFFILLISVNCFSQIEIEKTNTKAEKDKNVVPKLEDKINLNEYRTAEQFLGLIGNEIFYLPENPKYDFYSDQYESISYLPKNKFKLNKNRYKQGEIVELSRANKELFDFLKIKENYFVVDSIHFYEGLVYRKKINGFEFNEIQKKYSSKYSINGSVDIYTHHKINDEIVIFNISNSSSAEKLISVPYFNYLQDKFSDQKVILKKREYKYYSENEELSNYNRKYLDSAQIFQITKITLKEPKSEYEKYYTPSFTLKKLDNTTQEFEFNQIKNSIIFLDDFIKGADLRDKREAAKKDSLEKVRISEAKIEQEKKEILRINKEKRYNRLIKKYGKEFGERIANYKVSIGMSKEMCEDAWGKPESINRTTNSYGTSEQWVYGGGNYLYFDNGKLTTIQN